MQNTLGKDNLQKYRVLFPQKISNIYIDLIWALEHIYHPPALHGLAMLPFLVAQREILGYKGPKPNLKEPVTVIFHSCNWTSPHPPNKTQLLGFKWLHKRSHKDCFLFCKSWLDGAAQRLLRKTQYSCWPCIVRQILLLQWRSPPQDRRCW